MATVLEAITEANTAAGIETISFANIVEFQAFMDSFKFSQYPVNVVVPFTSNGQTLNGIRRSTIPLQGWVLTRVTTDPVNYRTAIMESDYMEPMRILAIKFIKNLLLTDIIDPQAGAVRDSIRPEYMFLNARVFGVAYTIDLPIIQNVCV